MRKRYMEALEEAISVAGNAAALAAGVGCSKSAPGMWKQRGCIPAEWCPSIERYTREKGRPVLCERLNPDVEWYVLRATNVASPSSSAPAEAGEAAHG